MHYQLRHICKRNFLIAAREHKIFAIQIAMQFFNYLKKFVPITEDEFQKFIQPYLIERKFEKKEIVSKEGEVEDYLNFIVHGLARKYYLKDNDEVNTQISHEGHIIHAQESFHSRQPSEYFVETLEPTTFISITYNDLEKLYGQHIKLERLGRLVITYTMVQKDRWQMQMIKLSPRERFLFFVERHPDLLQRVPQKHLASFLNIQPETFSRFKHLVKVKKAQP
jgi:CRP-like cAMP-binding protein